MKNEKSTNSNIKKAFDNLYKGEKSQSFRDIFRNVYGNDYPEEADHDSFVTMTDLHNIVMYFNVGQGEKIIDIGCGRGGPGLWITREIGASYVGLDISDIAVKKAVKRIEEKGLKDIARVQVGNICKTNFADSDFDGAMSIDTLGSIPQLSEAICEVARIIRLNANFIFTSYEEKNSKLLKDYRPLLQKAGFEITIYEEIPDWERRQREVYQKVLSSKKNLIKDMGLEGAFPWIIEAKTFLPRLKEMRRIFAVAKKI
jgi:ubiquinone/menaquinone biosynthesis C-methylase UbiE